ncbi:hypothetical protein KY310_03345, partial [Candidatus Woesearchaeota archaeon]|nr:hypothetical protein [Candidatus Woesearchaeota archaeon]
KTRASIEIAGRTFKRGSITKLVRSLRKIPDMHTELPYFNGKSPRVIAAKGQVYIALMKVTNRQVVVYDPADRKVKQIQFTVHKHEPIPEGDDDIYLDDIAELEAEEY